MTKKLEKPDSKEAKISLVITPAEKVDLVEKICQEYESADVTIESVCGKYGISPRTLRHYCAENSQFAIRYKKAKAENALIGKEGTRTKALDGLRRLLTGFFVEETETIQFRNKKGDVTSTMSKIKKKYIPPSTTAVLFALKNVDPEVWNNDALPPGDEERQFFRIGGREIVF